MASGPTARIDPVEIDGTIWFRTIGGIGSTVSADYSTLEDALDAVQLFARPAWDVAAAAPSFRSGLEDERKRTQP
jgi:hypothetical protein